MLDAGQRERAAQDFVAEHLRRLRAPQRLARLGPDDARVVAQSLQRIRHRHGEEATDVVILERLPKAQRFLPGQAGPHGVVHDDPVVGGDVFEARERVANRLGARRAAAAEQRHARGNGDCRFEPVVVGREHDVRARERKVREEAVERVLQHRLAAQRQVLLGQAGTEPESVARGGDESVIRHRVAVVGWARLGSNQRPSDYESPALTD